MQISLDGKVALVTGASRGIGRAIATRLASAGAAVMLSSRKQDELDAAASAIDGVTATFAAHAGDVEQADACVAATVDQFGRLDILVNNAATNPHLGPALEVTPAAFDKTVEVNLRGPLFWSQSAYRRSFADRPGVILNVASTGGLRVESGVAIYNVTKAALIHLTRHLASEIGPTRVVGIAPGLIRTDFSAALIERVGLEWARTLPTGRIGEVSDVADLALFLVSDHASWVTGETFVVDGGSGVRPVSAAKA